MEPANIRRLSEHDIEQYRNLMALFAVEFAEEETYQNLKPSESYVAKLLKNLDMVFLVAHQKEEVVGGLVAYVLHKFEQERSEVYIYDLAVKSNHRRRGIATSLIQALKPIAKEAGAWVIFVQADYVDPPAIKLYESLGVKEEVLHFDIKL